MTKYPILINDNCFKTLKKLKDNSIDLVVTDPPYDVKIEGFGKTLKGADNKISGFDRNEKI